MYDVNSGQVSRIKGTGVRNSYKARAQYTLIPYLYNNGKILLPEYFCSNEWASGHDLTVRG